MSVSHRLTTQLLVGTTAFALGLTASIACTSIVPNPNHCSNTTGDTACAEKYPDGSRPYCGVGTCFPDVEDGCVDARPSDECYTACGGRMTVDEDDSCLAAGDGGSGSTDDAMTMDDTLDGPATDGATGDSTGTGETGDSTGDSGTTTGPMPCDGPDDCPDVGAPYCSSEGLCVSCDEAPTPADADQACAALDAALPACADAGVCVACTATNTAACAGNTPICDLDAETCVGCAQHSQCPESACHIPSSIVGEDDPDDGACFDPLGVINIDGDGGMDFTTIAQGVGAVPISGEGVLILHDWSGNYDEQVTIGSNKTIAILAAPGPQPNWIQGSNDPLTNPNLRIDGGATVFIHALLINANNDPDGPGIEVNGARLHAQRSRIVNNSGGGVGVTNGVLELENCFVSGSSNPVVAPAVTATSSNLAVRYSTMVRGFNAGSPVLACTTPVTTTLHDSIVVNQTSAGAMELSWIGATVVASALETITDASPWFDDVNSGDYLLTPAGATQFADVAEWNTGDPPTDIDGVDLRPTVDGTADVAGADLP